MMKKIVLRGLAISAIACISLPAASIGVNFSGISLQDTFNLGTGAVPPDMGMAVGPNQIVQLINGGYQVYSRTGAAQGATVTDTAFWNNAGISSSITNPGLSDPRVIYDPVSQRFFASEINVSSTGNQALIAVSKTSNPLDGWNSVHFTSNTGFGDFPMLGIDKNAVYLSTNNFTSDVGYFTGVSVFSIPKSDLLLSTPTVANISSFQNLNANVVGFGMNPAIDYGGSHGALLAISNTTFNEAEYSTISGASGPGAVLSAATTLTGLSDGTPIAQRQPDGTRTVDGGDDRFGSSPFVVGNLLYATNTISDSNNGATATHDIVHWLIEDLTTKSVLVQGMVSDAAYDYTYSSIAANANGDFVLAFNRSGAGTDGNISALAEVCHFNGTTASCESPLVLKAGEAGNYQLGSSVRWGDYSAIAIDPNDSNSFWASLEVPVVIPDSGTYWGTQITQLTLTDTPEPGTFVMLAGAFGALLGWKRRKIQN